MNIININTPVIIAHRGYKTNYPENTLSSFRAAVESNSQMVELDVTLTKDRQIIVIHDDTVDRTTNGNGYVNQLTFEQIRNLDAGSWFAPDFSDEILPTLEEVLIYTKNRVFVNIEIKQSAYEPNRPKDAIEKQVLRLINDLEMMDQVIISSFEKNILYHIRELNPRIALSYVTESPLDDQTIDILNKIDAYSWNQDMTYLSPKDIDQIHLNGFKVFTYTVNKKTDALRLFSWGVDGIFSDTPYILDSE